MQKINILIVDDREENIIALEALIQRSDINIITTTSPNEALKLAWESEISIALVDVQMPEIDGFELVEMLKSNPRTKDILVIFVTAISKETKYAVKGLGTGAIDYLYKPLDPNITAAKVDSFIQLAKAQMEIKNKNEELSNYAIVVNNSADIICSVEAKTNRILSISPAIEKVTGYKPSEVLQKKITEFLVNDEKENFLQELSKVKVNDHNHATFETKIKTFNEKTIWVECRVTYKAGTFFMNINDISSQKEYSTELILAKDQAIIARKGKEIFLANMSHELRTPINGIIGISNLLMSTVLDDQQKEMVKLLEISSQSLLGVINDVLDISKIESGKFSIIRKEINIKELLKSVTDILRFKADEKLIKLNLQIDENVPNYIYADGLRLNQILMNLLSNAIKFTENGSVNLVVKAQNHDASCAEISFSVEDTGIGIAPEKLDHIFESYNQAEDDTANKYGGTGLGLTIVKKLAELKGGTLVTKSTLGKGSVFTFKNKFAIQNGLSDFINDFDPNLKSLKGIKILIAEDNLVSQFMVNKILKSWDATTETVNSGLKVLERLKEQDFDLILMDTHMPEMGGFETARKIRKEFEGNKKEVKIISLSAAVLEDDRELALHAGMNEVLTKPFVPDDLHRLISKVLCK
ncbi:MAG: response regulator [Pelobium sp.]